MIFYNSRCFTIFFSEYHTVSSLSLFPDQCFDLLASQVLAKQTVGQSSDWPDKLLTNQKTNQTVGQSNCHPVNLLASQVSSKQSVFRLFVKERIEHFQCLFHKNMSPFRADEITLGNRSVSPSANRKSAWKISGKSAIVRKLNNKSLNRSTA